MTAVTNPSQFVITEAAAQVVTGFQVQFGKTSGGPYTLIAPVPAADVNSDDSGATGTIASLNEQLAPGTWFAVANALNSGSVSINSPEVEIIITPPVPSAPTLTVS